MLEATGSAGCRWARPAIKEASAEEEREREKRPNIKIEGQREDIKTVKYHIKTKILIIIFINNASRRLPCKVHSL